MKKTLKLVGIVLIVLVVLMFVFGPPNDESNVVYTENFIVANPVDLTQIESISQFRSCMGHDYSGWNTQGEKETNRTMKHYLTQKQEFNNSVGKLKIFAPFDGKIAQVDADRGPENITRGVQVWLKPDAAKNWYFVFFHIDLLNGFKKGSQIKAGELIGYANVQDAANFDFILKKSEGFKGPNIMDTPFYHMTEDVLAEYTQVGVTAENMVISKEYRDSNSCTYDGGLEDDGQIILK